MELEDVTGSSLLTFPPEGLTPPPPHLCLLQFRSKGRTRKDCTKTWWLATTPGWDRWPTTRKASPLNSAWPSGRSSTWCVNCPHLFTEWLLCCTSQRVWGILHKASHTQPFFLWFEYSQSRLSDAAQGPLYLVHLVGTWVTPRQSWFSNARVHKGVESTLQRFWSV